MWFQYKSFVSLALFCFFEEIIPVDSVGFIFDTTHVPYWNSHITLGTVPYQYDGQELKLDHIQSKSPHPVSYKNTTEVYIDIIVGCNNRYGNNFVFVELKKSYKNLRTYGTVLSLKLCFIVYIQETTVVVRNTKVR